MTIIPTLIVVTSVRQWYISQLDVKNAFLNGDLQKKVYMALLPGVSHDSKYVYKLKKTLYDLEQAPHAWFEKIFVVISSLRFVSSSHDYVYLLSALMQVVSFCFYMLITWLLLVMTLMIF
jgi:hypothetical protein